MRIVGGKFKGHSIAPPHGSATRPTSDRVRESVFNILAHGIDGLALEGARDYGETKIRFYHGEPS